jgi:hypothetical protein
MGIGVAIAAGLADIGVPAAIASVAGPVLFGAATGALISGVTGGNPLTGALFGGAGGALTQLAGPALNALTGSGGLTADASGAAAVGDSGLAPAAADTAGAANVAAATGADPALAGQLSSEIAGQSAGAGTVAATTPSGSFWSNLNPLNLFSSGTPSTPSEQQTTGNYATDAGNQAINQTLYGPDPNAPATPGTTAAAAGSSSGGGGINTTTAMLGALAAGAQYLSRPTATTPNYSITPGPSTTAANQGPLFNQPQTTTGYINRSQVPNYTPAGGSWYTYGQTPGQPQFFTGNQLTLARGGALAHRIAMEHARHMAHGAMFDTRTGQHHVHGPGDGTSDSVPADLSDGEYVLTAADVARIGQGSNEAGARKLDEFRDRLARESGQKKFIPAKTRGALDHLRRRAA